MPENESTLDESLESLIKYAPAMRQAGITRVEVGDVKADLAPHYEAIPSIQSSNDLPEEDLDPWNDPATFGGSVPGFKNLHKDEKSGGDES